MPVVKFEKIDAEIIDFESTNLSSDQTYLLKITNAVITGHVDERLTKASPGKLCHSRWLTMANRLIRLYISTELPSLDLKLLVQYVVKVYSQTWFDIRKDPSINKGSTHFLNIIKRSRFLPNNLKEIVYNCMKRNSFFGHSENIILNLLTHSELETRQMGLSIYEIALENFESNNRHFQLPPLNCCANSLIELLDVPALWSPPPILSQFTKDKVKNLAISGQMCALFCEIPCHSQAVERHVCLVSKASKAVCGEDKRDGMIRNILKSQKENPFFDSKRQYNL